MDKCDSCKHKPTMSYTTSECNRCVSGNRHSTMASRDPNKAFKRKKEPEYTTVRDNGVTYYKIKCLGCNFERWASAGTWNSKSSKIACNNCEFPSWIRI